MDNQEQVEETHTDTHATPETQTESVPDELAQALAQAEEYKLALQRERADFQNFRKRTERENDTLKDKLRGDVLLRFLPILDDFERALQSQPADEKDQAWLSGIQAIYRKLQSNVEAEGVTFIDPLGQPFDPNFHEAIGADEATDGVESGHVTAVLQKGYLLGEKVLRPAMVRVAS